MRGLTEKQRKVLGFIEDYFEKHGYPPSIRDIARRFRITPRGAQMHLLALEKKGYIQRSGKKARAMRLTKRTEAVLLPVLGRIAAGDAIEMFEYVEEEIEVPIGMVKPGYDHFVLVVEGDSMIGDHIVDGDYVVLRRQDHAESGDVVAISVDGSRATLKRIYTADGKVELRPSNPEMDPIRLDPSRVRILGKLVGLIRVYR